MKRILLFTIVKGSLNNAGPKAPLDICRILTDIEGIEIFSLSCEKSLDYSAYLKALTYLRNVKKEEMIVIIQYPFQPDHYHVKQRLFVELLKEMNPCSTWI